MTADKNSRSDGDADTPTGTPETTPSEPTQGGKKQHFPETLLTQLDRWLVTGDEGLAKVRHHVMSVYREPLKIYFQGRSDRWLGDPEEIVVGFFADRLARPEYLANWRSHGGRLRYWLIRGLDYYLKELRKKRQNIPLPTGTPSEEIASDDEGSERAFDRAFIKSLIREALERAEATCSEEGLLEHWRVFELHCLMGMSFPELCEEVQLEPERAAVMSRTATKRFRASLRDIMMHDGVTPELVNQELSYLLEVISS